MSPRTRIDDGDTDPRSGRRNVATRSTMRPPLTRFAGSWNVNDIATAELMKAFYRNLTRGMSKDDALREAKLLLINGRQHTWRHPYFWAPFVLSGIYN